MSRLPSNHARRAAAAALTMALKRRSIFYFVSTIPLNETYLFYYALMLFQRCTVTHTRYYNFNFILIPKDQNINTDGANNS